MMHPTNFKVESPTTKRFDHMGPLLSYWLTFIYFMWIWDFHRYLGLPAVTINPFQWITLRRIYLLCTSNHSICVLQCISLIFSFLSFIDFESVHTKNAVQMHLIKFPIYYHMGNYFFLFCMVTLDSGRVEIPCELFLYELFRHTDCRGLANE